MHLTHKNIALILVAALIIGGAFALAEFRNSQTKEIVYSAPEVKAMANALTPELESMDSDNDGLKDWEEGLLGTNAHLADTDGDGTKDGAEATAGRNPLVKGPNDKGTPAKNNAAALENLTPTDKLARDFFARYMELNKAGLIEDKESQQALVEQVIKNGTVLTKPKTLTLKDILIKDDISAAAIRQYGNELGAVFLKYDHPEWRSEVAIAKDSIDNDEPEILKELDPIIANYKKIIDEIVKIKAPLQLSENHLLLVNSLLTLRFTAESLRKLDTDPLAGVQGVSIYLNAAAGLNRAFTTLKTNFTDHSISYGPTDGGRFFVPQ